MPNVPHLTAVAALLFQVAPKPLSAAEIMRGVVPRAIATLTKLQGMTIVHASCLTVLL